MVSSLRLRVGQGVTNRMNRIDRILGKIPYTAILFILSILLPAVILRFNYDSRKLHPHTSG